MQAALLAWLGVGFVLLPLLWGVIFLLLPATSIEVWKAVIEDPQIPKAFALTLFSALGSTLIALFIASWAMIRFYPSQRWTSLQIQTPFFLAFPHAAFAIGVTFLFAPSGWLARLLSTPFTWDAPPQWVTIQDPWGISLMLVLALKESWFLLWVMFALPVLPQLQNQIINAQSMGYSQQQIGWQILFPQVLPKLSWALLAVFSYSVSVVDMAIILGPSTPPPLAVLGWQWFADFDPLQHDKASVVSLILLMLLLAGFLLGWLLLNIVQRLTRSPSGVRKMDRAIFKGLPSTISLNKTITVFAILMLILWSFAGSWFFPESFPHSLNLSSWQKSDFTPLWLTLWLALSSVFLALPIALLWLEWGPKHQGWLYFPLILPPLTLAAAQYEVLLRLQFDNSFIGVVWSHLAWVLPYMVLVLAGSYRTFDDRYVLRAHTLGYSQWNACLRIKWPMLIRPILAACAVGFAVSVSQYLPTLFAGGGRFETVTTEAVALSAGGNRRILAIQALLQALLPLLGFMAAIMAGLLLVRNRKGMQ